MFFTDYDIDIASHLSMAYVVVDVLSRRPVVCGALLASMGIQYEDQREDVADRVFVAVLVRITNSLTISDSIR